jgi:hypothetical protein
MFREAFLNKLSLLLRGTVAAPADRFGETLADEHMMGGEAQQPCMPLYGIHAVILHRFRSLYIRAL